MKTKPVKCRVCGQVLKSAQGLSGHMRFVHGTTSAGQPLKKQPPVLVKPRSGGKTIQELLMENTPSTRTSPCCSAALRDAQSVLGVRESALVDCYICARCGEWYKYELGGFIQVRGDGSRGVSHLKHLPSEPAIE
jgi:ribosomal protein S27E